MLPVDRVPGIRALGEPDVAGDGVYRRGTFSNLLLIYRVSGHGAGMKTLIQHNPYLSNPIRRHAMLAQSVRESSIYEGARCFHASSSRKRASTRPRKKPAKG